MSAAVSVVAVELGNLLFTSLGFARNLNCGIQFLVFEPRSSVWQAGQGMISERMFASSGFEALYKVRQPPNKSVKPLACGSLGHSVLRTCSGMASPLLPEQALHTECRLPRR